MTSDTQYVYELTYSVGELSSEDYETWVQSATEQWITTEELHGFRCEQSLTGTNPLVRLKFEFETLADWAVFVTSGTYRENTEQLRSITDGVGEALWEPTTIPLWTSTCSDQSMTGQGTRETR